MSIDAIWSALALGTLVTGVILRVLQIRRTGQLACVRNLLQAAERLAEGKSEAALQLINDAISSSSWPRVDRRARGGGYCLRAQVYAALHRYEEALEDCRQAVELAPSSTDAYEWWGIVLLRMHRYEEAESKLDKVLQLDSKSLSTYVNRAGVRIKLASYPLRSKIVTEPWQSMMSRNLLTCTEAMLTLRRASYRKLSKTITMP